MSTEILRKLKQLNPDRMIFPITDRSFLRYGKVHTQFAVDQFMGYLETHITREE